MMASVMGCSTCNLRSVNSQGSGPVVDIKTTNLVFISMKKNLDGSFASMMNSAKSAVSY